MNILVVTLGWPFPALNGMNICTATMVSALVREAEVTVFCLDSEGDGSETTVPGGEIKRIGMPCQRPRTLGNYLQSWMAGHPHAPHRNWNAKAQAWFDENRDRFDVIFFDHLFCSTYAGHRLENCVLLAHNAEYILWRRASVHMKNPLLRLVTWLESFRLQAMERRICRGAEAVVALTKEDAGALVALTPGAQIHIIPPCFPGGAEPSRRVAPASNSLLFVGTLSWEPNADGLLWFVREIWPMVRSKHPQAHLDVVGKGLSPKYTPYLKSAEGVCLHGFVEDLAPYFENARVFVCPLRFGSGIKLKVLEAMNRGLPVICSPVGAEGFYMKEDPPFPVCRGLGDWVTQIDRLLVDDTAWLDQSEAQHLMARESYAPANRTSSFKAILCSLCPTGGS